MAHKTQRHRAVELSFTWCFNNKMFLFEYIFIRIRKINLQKLHIIPCTYTFDDCITTWIEALCRIKCVFYTFTSCRGTFCRTAPISHKYTSFNFKPKILRLFSFHFFVVGFSNAPTKNVLLCEEKSAKSNCNYPSLIKNFYHFGLQTIFHIFPDIPISL